MRRWKPGVRTVGVDDGPFPASPGGSALVVGAVYRGAERFEGIVSCRVRRDGYDSTRKIAGMIVGSKYHPQIQAVLVDGVALAGFNVVDLPRLAHLLARPTILVIRSDPDLTAMRRALDRVSQPERRWRTIQRAGPIHPAGPIRFQCAGVDPGAVPELLEHLTLEGHMPEPLRGAHMIAGGIVRGESPNRA